MAETDSNTVPAVQPSGMHRPPRTIPSELLPLEPAVFEAIHRLNSRFERILHDFRGLQTFPYFPHHKLTLGKMSLASSQAETNFALSAAIHQRAETNALYFEHGISRFKCGFRADLILTESRLLQREISHFLQQNLLATDLSTLIPDVMSIADLVSVAIEES